MNMSTITELKTESKSSRFLSPAEVRSLLKQNLQINSRQVSVKTNSSVRYLTLTVWDANVDIEAVRSFAASLDTLEMDMTDYCSGQSIAVVISDEVKDALAAPYLEFVRGIKFPEAPGVGNYVGNGVIAWRVDEHRCNFSISKTNFETRNLTVWDIKDGVDWAIRAAAYEIAIIISKAAIDTEQETKNQYTVTYGAKTGPNIWEDIMVIEAEEISEALKLAIQKAADKNGSVFSITQDN